MSEVRETEVGVVFDEAGVDVVEEGVDGDVAAEGVFFGGTDALRVGEAKRRGGGEKLGYVRKRRQEGARGRTISLGIRLPSA